MSESGTFETREGSGTFIEVEDAPSPKRARYENAEIEQTEIVHVSKPRAIARCCSAVRYTADDRSAMCRMFACRVACGTGVLRRDV